MEEMIQPEKKVIIRGKGVHNKWKWSTIIVSVLSVIIISFLSYQLYSVSQNNPVNSNGTMQGPSGDGAPSGTPPSGEPGQTPNSSDDSSDSSTNDSTSSSGTL
ncbi:hypothetical protein IBB71_06690 [Listeria welshimeri]|uniref:hypothetical protein n=1 Tax=Listeria welshimeri TaxID=1643 RepID=UPI0018893E63|nr:hypothetical protein [Listeria welshimeri]MBF2379094.1 hypothetical protein [Listeria welshimeri]MBF2505758.1 hypothetical protein [Listeria welshimeri]MBF2561700.1 hypothetical protein [Listeria welshimeri]MBF2658179.1 hypothetical protein [Listeria welshimeri]